MHEGSERSFIITVAASSTVTDDAQTLTDATNFVTHRICNIK